MLKCPFGPSVTPRDSLSPYSKKFVYSINVLSMYPHYTLSVSWGRTRGSLHHLTISLNFPLIFLRAGLGLYFSSYHFFHFWPNEWMNEWSETDCSRGVMGKPWTGNHEAWCMNWRNRPASMASRFPWKGVRKSVRWCSWLLSHPAFYGVLETPSSSISGGIDKCCVVLTDPRCIPWHRKQLRACISIQRLSNHSMTHVKCQK